MSSNIQADVHMISGCKDYQTSADVSNIADFQLPNPAGRAGGACTSALLKVLYADQRVPDEQLTFQKVLLKMRENLREDGFEQIPQLTSSKMLSVSESPFEIVPESARYGTKRAVLIGINYVGQSGELSGCHNDTLNIKKYLTDALGFQEENITVLMDDGYHREPTRDNIMYAYQKLVSDSQEGDAIFCHYSGHGGRLEDEDGDEEDGYDETLVPLDFDVAGQIRDDDLFLTLVQPMPAGVTLTCLMDCCHSGTVLDLPYKFVADGDSDEMEYDESYQPDKFDALFAAAAAAPVIMEVAAECCDCTVQ